MAEAASLRKRPRKLLPHMVDETEKNVYEAASYVNKRIGLMTNNFRKFVVEDTALQGPVSGHVLGHFVRIGNPDNNPDKLSGFGIQH